jgi:hypothetical protein
VIPPPPIDVVPPPPITPVPPPPTDTVPPPPIDDVPPPVDEPPTDDAPPTDDGDRKHGRRDIIQCVRRAVERRKADRARGERIHKQASERSFAELMRKLKQAAKNRRHHHRGR